MESELEKSHKGIKLVREDEQLKFTNDHREFTSNPLVIPSVGVLYIWGNRRFENSGNAITFKNGSIQKSTPELLYDEGLYEIAIALRNFPRKDQKITIRMKFPDGTTVSSPIWYGIDEVQPEENRTEKYYAHADDWRYEKENKKEFIYLPADTKILSQLELFLEGL